MGSIVSVCQSWRAQVEFKGKRIYKTCRTKAQAKAWIERTERQLQDQTFLAEQENKKKEAEKFTVDSLLYQYIREVHPHRPFCRSKMATIKMTAAHFEGVKVTQLTPDEVFQYAVKRREGYGDRPPISRSTANQQITYLAQTIEHAKALWGLQLAGNPAREALKVLSKVGLTGGSRKRERRVSDHELELLLEAAKKHRTGWLAPMIRIAVHTAMRQGEIHALTWRDIDLEQRTIFIKDRKHPHEKKGNNQIIPMSRAAQSVFEELKPYKKTVRIFPDVETAQSVSKQFSKTAAQAGLKGLHFHDLRHEAVSRFFEKGLQIQEVARISGHRDWKQLLRYTQLKATDLVDKLD